jgi:hypothetical protein
MTHGTNDWHPCPSGALDRLEQRLKSHQQHKSWGYALSVFALSGIIAFCTWHTAAALMSGFGGSSSYGSANPAPCRTLPTPPSNKHMICAPDVHVD